MKLSKIFLPLIAAVALTGCDSFLDIQPVGKVIPTTAGEFLAHNRGLLQRALRPWPYIVPHRRGAPRCHHGWQRSQLISRHLALERHLGGPEHGIVQLAYVLPRAFHCQLHH